MTHERLNKLLAKTPYAESRRKADALIGEGHVQVNGNPAELGQTIDPEVDVVHVDGTRVRFSEKTVIIALHKPSGAVCTKHDPFVERTVYDLIPSEYRTLHIAGRLDADSTGLVLFTNDGELTQSLTHPSNEHEKEYVIIVKGNLGESALSRLKKGIMMEGRRTAPADIRHIAPIRNGTKTRFHMIIHEGRKHQIRRMLDAVGLAVVSLHRIRIGSFTLESLQEGEWRIVTEQEAPNNDSETRKFIVDRSTESTETTGEQSAPQ